METLISYFLEIITNVNFLFKNWSNVKVKSLSTSRKTNFISRNIYVKYQSSSTTYSNVINKVKVYKMYAKLQGKKCWYPWTGSVTRNTHVKYQSFSTHISNFINKVIKK